MLSLDIDNLTTNPQMSSIDNNNNNSTKATTSNVISRFFALFSKSNNNGGDSITNEANDSISDPYGYNYDRQLLLSYDPQHIDDIDESTENAQHASSRQHEQSMFTRKRLMRHVGNLVVTLTFIAMLGIISYFTYKMIDDPHQEDTDVYIWTGLLVTLTILISTREIYLHFTHWYMPDVQRYVVRILYMVPLYGASSWLSLKFHDARLYIDTIRDFYEGFVIYSFVNYLIELLGGEDTLAETLRYKDAHYGEHKCGFQYCFRSWTMGREFMLECKWGTLQYVIIKIITTVVIFVLESQGYYCEGDFDYSCGYIYISIILNVSVTWALYCLVIFYHATQDDLTEPKNWHPLGKFLCIKGVVFFTFWQSVLIAILYAEGIIKEVGDWGADRVAASIQDILISIEMLFFAIAHRFTFTYKECLPEKKNRSLKDQRSESHGSLNYAFMDHTEDDVYSEPGIIRTVDAPMGITRALWSSTVPNDTLSDIIRLGTGSAMQSDDLQTPMISLNQDAAESI